MGQKVSTLFGILSCDGEYITSNRFEKVKPKWTALHFTSSSSVRHERTKDGALFPFGRILLVFGKWLLRVRDTKHFLRSTSFDMNPVVDEFRTHFLTVQALCMISRSAVISSGRS